MSDLRFQTPYFWPSHCWAPENTDYAVYLCKRTMQNKSRLQLADYEAENLSRLQKMFSRKWEFIYMQAEAQVKVTKQLLVSTFIYNIFLEGCQEARKARKENT